MLSLQEIVQTLSVAYPNTIQERDSYRVAMFLRDFTSQLRLENVITNQQQAILTIDENYRAQLPAGINRNGKIILSVCVCGQLFTIDIQNTKCPAFVKKSTCGCETPTPKSCDSGDLCGCSVCGGVIGYGYGTYFGTPYGAWTVPYAPIGKVNSLNPYGSAMIENDTIIFSTNLCVLNDCYDLRLKDVYILYEELVAPELVQISPFWGQAAQYYVLSRIKQDTDPNGAMFFEAQYKKQIYQNKKINYSARINWDSMYRAYASGLGVIK